MSPFKTMLAAKPSKGAASELDNLKLLIQASSLPLPKALLSARTGNSVPVTMRIDGRSQHDQQHHFCHSDSTLPGIFVLPLENTIVEVPAPWYSIGTPAKSYFDGFDPPYDLLRWNQAELQASRGEQPLLAKVLEVIKLPEDTHQKDSKCYGSLH